MEVEVTVIFNQPGSDPVPEYVNEQHVAAATGLSRKTLQEWRYRGGGPPFIKLSETKRGRVRYHWPTVLAWFASRARTNTGGY